MKTSRNALDVELEIDVLNKKLTPLTEEVSKLNKEISNLRAELSWRKARPGITDHALLRYLERHEGIDIDKLRKDLLGVIEDQLVEGMTSIKSNGITFKVAGKTVTTIV